MKNIRGNRYGIERNLKSVISDFENLQLEKNSANYIPKIYYQASISRIKKQTLFDFKGWKLFVKSMLTNKRSHKIGKCDFDEIKIKNNLIGFNKKNKTVCKIYPSSKIVNTYLNGSTTFKRINTSYIQTPKIVRNSKNIITEDMVGNPCKNISCLCLRNFLRDLMKFHFAKVKFMEFDKLNINIKEIHNRRLAYKIEKLLTSKPKIVIGYTHGDLALSNIVKRENGEVYLIDWELFNKNGLIGHEVAKFIKNYSSDIIEEVVKFYVEKCPLKDINLINQFIIGGVLMLKNNREKVPDYFLNAGYSEDIVSQKISRREDNINKSLELFVELKDRLTN